MGGLLTAAILASLYWVCLLAAPIFAGTAWTDPEFKPITPGQWVCIRSSL